MMLSRFTYVLGLLLFVGSLFSVGCSSEEGSLVIYDWPTSNDARFYSRFTEKYPEVKTRIVPFGEDTEAYGKLSGGFACDIVHPCSQFFQLYVDNGLIQPIDVSRIERWKDLFPSLKETGKINGKQYFIPYEWGYESILVRTDKVQTIPTSWADLWSPEYKGHVTTLNAPDSAHNVAALALGLDPWNTTSAQNEQIMQKLIELKPNLLSYWTDSDEIKQLVASGDAWVSANVWNDAYAELLAEGVPVEYITPKEGRIGWVCSYAISSSTKNLDMVYEYLNALLDPKSHAAFGDMSAYGVSSSSALALMNPDTVKNMQLDDLKALDTTVFSKSWTEEQRKDMTERWLRVQAAQ